MAATRNQPLKPLPIPPKVAPASEPEIEPRVSPAALPTPSIFQRQPSVNLSQLTGVNPEAGVSSNPPLGTIRAGGMANTTNPTAFLAGRLTSSGTSTDIVALGDAALASMLQGLADGPSFGALASLGAGIGSGDIGSGGIGNMALDPSTASGLTGAELGQGDSGPLGTFPWQTPKLPSISSDDSNSMWDDDEEEDS